MEAALARAFLEQARAVHYFRLWQDGRIDACNDAAAAILRVPRDRLAGAPLVQFLAEQDGERLLAELRVSGRRSQPVRLNFCGSDHSPYTLDCWLDVEADGRATLIGEPPLDEDKRQQRQLLDVSHELALLARERARLSESERRARLEAEVATREKDRALATIAHELRQPLGTMRFSVALLSRETTADIRQRALDGLDRQLAHLTRLVEDLLDAARIREQKLQLIPEPLDLRDVLHDVADGMAAKAAAAGLTFACHVQETAAWVHADRTRMRQVFSNLLENAVRYTDPPGSITVSLSVSDGTVSVLVRDTGRGIAPDVLPRVFQLFGQAGDGEHGGLGIGLSVAHGIVTLHGGRIEAHSPGVGRDAEFVVSLPVWHGSAASGVA